MAQAHAAEFVDQYQAGRALQFVGRHGQRNRPGGARLIDGDGKVQPVLVHKGFQGHRRHRRVMFKHRMQADQNDLFLRERLPDLLRLRQPMRDAAGAEHLKGMQDHHAPAQIGQRQAGRVQPLRGLEGRRQERGDERVHGCGFGRGFGGGAYGLIFPDWAASLGAPALERVWPMARDNSS